MSCGLVNPEAACRCDRRVTAAVRTGRVDPEHLMFARPELVTTAIDEMERFHDAASLMRSHPDYQAPASLRRRLREMLVEGRFSIVDGGATEA